MAVPKTKVSKAKRDSRKANWKVSTPSLVECSNCHEMIKQHQVCPKCGYYKGEKKITLKSDKETKN
ncbi:MAG: 50S ribosomal protein L32 [Spirochaetales bacterium]